MSVLCNVYVIKDRVEGVIYADGVKGHQLLPYFKDNTVVVKVNVIKF